MVLPASEAQQVVALKTQSHGLVAPMVERLFCNQEAVGSNPTLSTRGRGPCVYRGFNDTVVCLSRYGVLAHLVERRYGMAEAESSSLSDSTQVR